MTVDTSVVEGLDFQQESVIRTSNGGESHGGGDVQLYGAGAGSKIFKGTIDNTKVFTLVKSAAGL
ncbi:alkaline phosphatase precursor [Oxalobacteraceae bacterium IMCC9480]|nr:alkaline phosphatase precursor [Oxalobacteraceae bacterium IMCC9480]